jgi:DNA polymerase-1
MIASQILSEGESIKHSLLAVSKREADFDLDKTYQTSSWSLDTLTQQQIKYSAEDILALIKIFPSLREKLNNIDTPHKATGKIYEIFKVKNPVAAVEFTFTPYLALIELRGMPISKEKLDTLLKEFSSKYQRSYINFLRTYGIDPFSPQKVSNWLINKLNIPLPKTDKGSYSSQDKVLKRFIDKQPIKELLEIRHTKKLLDKLKELKQYAKEQDNIVYKVHSDYRQIGAPTGRMSSSRPNLQNITYELKEVFTAPDGYLLIIADYSQIELRIASEYTNEQTMIKAFKEGKDLHKFTASLITGKNYEDITKEERKLAKAINFGLIYGISPKSLMEYAVNNYGIEISLKEAKQFYEKFFQVYTGFKSWHESIKKQLKKVHQITVSSLLGRKMKAKRFTDAVNYPIQATGSDMLKMAVNFFYKTKKDLDAYIVNLVHDEIIVEVKEEQAEQAKKILEESMLKAGKILLKKVPIEYEVIIAKSWSEK